MDSNWVKAYSSSDFLRAELIRQLLVENDIEAVILNKKDSSYHFGEVQIWTAEADAQAAKALITQHETD